MFRLYCAVDEFSNINRAKPIICGLWIDYTRFKPFTIRMDITIPLGLIRRTINGAAYYGAVSTGRVTRDSNEPTCDA